jgi:hypothetical protein
VLKQANQAAAYRDPFLARHDAKRVVEVTHRLVRRHPPPTRRAARLKVTHAFEDLRFVALPRQRLHEEVSPAERQYDRVDRGKPAIIRRAAGLRPTP